MIQLKEEDLPKYRKLTYRDIRNSMIQAIAYHLIPSQEKGFEDVHYYGEAFLDPNSWALKPEYVYVLVNTGHPGMCKIGYTTKSVWLRCKEINAATGVITPWYEAYSYKCPDGYALEQDIHNYLEEKGYRVSSNKEGFNIDTETAIKIIEELGSKYTN